MGEGGGDEDGGGVHSGAISTVFVAFSQLKLRAIF